MRVINMAGVDLSVYRFDYDLTFAALLMNADGTIYHIYGGRDWSDPMSHLDMGSFAKALNETLADHAAYRKSPKPPRKKPKTTIEDIPRWAREIKRGKSFNCFHCHQVYEGRIEHLQQSRKWKRNDTWLWPDPIQIGLELNDQTLVRAVEDGSPAARAGLAAGDRISALGDRRVRTFGDVQRVLHELSGKPETLKVAWERGGAAKNGFVKLKSAWKEATPLVYAWRGSKWPLSPGPGFGGKALQPDELEALGLSRDGFAFRIGYFVTWGRHAHRGRNAGRAGLRKGDVVVSIGGKSDFKSVEHYHAWFRLTQKEGKTVPVEVIRRGKRLELDLKVVQ